MDTRTLRQDGLFFLGIANLSLLPFWTLAFARNGMPTDAKFVDHYYELSQIFTHVDYVAALLLTLVVALILWAIGWGLERVSVTAVSWYQIVIGIAGLAMLAMTIWIIKNPPSGNLRISDGWILPFIAIGGVITILGVITAIRYAEVLRTFLRYAVLATTPIYLVLAANTIVAKTKIAEPSDGFLLADRTLAPIQPGPPGRDGAGPRVVVIVFDMWDYGVTFEKLPAEVKLPNVSRISGESFFATQALSVSRSTRIALPSMITGKRVVWSWPTSGDDLALIFSESYSPVNWRDHGGLFQTMRDAGYNTAVVSTAYHPYCRMFRKYISDCWIDDTRFDHVRRTPWNRMDNVVSDVLRFIPGVNRKLYGPRARFHSEWGVHLHLAFEETVVKVVTDPDLNFVFVHWLLPHPPFIRNHKTGEWQYFDEHANTDYYFGNLQALDMSVGRIRKAMEDAGLWEGAAVLLTADHGYTLSDWPEYAPSVEQRIPFILKLPGNSPPMRSDKTFSLTSIPNLVSGLANGQVRTSVDVEAFLELPTYYH